MFKQLLQILRGGIPLVFLGGGREICELINYEHNKSQNRVRLLVNFNEKFKEKQTGWWFDPEKDFDPPFSKMNWEDLGSTVIICWKSFDGSVDGRPMIVKHYTEQIQVLRESLKIYQREIRDILETIEMKKISSKREEEVFINAKALRAIKSLVLDPAQTASPETDKEPLLFNFGGGK